MQDNKNDLTEGKEIETTEEIERPSRETFDIEYTDSEYLFDYLKDETDIPPTETNIEYLREEIEDNVRDYIDNLDLEEFLDKVRNEIERDNERNEAFRRKEAFKTRLLDLLGAREYRNERNYLILRGILSDNYDSNLESISDSTIDYLIERFSERFDKVPITEVET